MKFKIITFADATYRVYENGTIFSYSTNRFIRGKKISKSNPRLVVDLRINNRIKSCLIHRLVYFLFVYKEKNKGTFESFEKMPPVLHLNGNLTDNRLSNLDMKNSHSEIAKWSINNFPKKFKTPLVKCKIESSEINAIKKHISQKKTYAEIGRIYGCSDMSVHRFIKRHQIVLKNVVY